LLTGETQKSPQDAYFFYYNVNELQAMRQGDWKLVFPHRFRSMKGQEPGWDGLPGNYTHFNVEAPELYNLVTDKEEAFNVAASHPDVVAALLALAEAMRGSLGDALTEREGSENRMPGRVAEVKQ
jgi:arylsulfatase